MERDSYNAIDAHLEAVLKDDIDKIDTHLPPLVMHSTVDGKIHFRFVDLVIPLDLTNDDTRTLGKYYSVLGTFASYGHDRLARYDAKIILLEKTIADREGELIAAHTRGKSDKDLKPTLLNKLIAGDSALLEMRSHLALYNAIKTLIKGRITAYEARIAILSREFTRRGIRSTET